MELVERGVGSEDCEHYYEVIMLQSKLSEPGQNCLIRT